MLKQIIESQYPINFRESDSKKLGNILKNRNSAVLIGMRRVGISNFLRFFLYHSDIPQKYISDSQKHLFIPVDLNDLVEREIFPFWMLTLKRIVDSIETSPLADEIKKDVETFFLDSIQSNDLFLLIDCVRQSLIKIISANFLPTIFYIRFDRMTGTATPQLLNNLEGLISATHHKLAYVFTSSRKLDQINSEVFKHSNISFASNTLFIQPAKKEDMEIISQTYLTQYSLNLSQEIKKWLFELIDGYVQYMQLALIILSESKSTLNGVSSKEELLKMLLDDERIALQSEELWDDLTQTEKEILLNAVSKKSITKDEREEAKYLWETGVITDIDSKNLIFSPLFEDYLTNLSTKLTQDNTSTEFSKKENLLFNFLKENLDQICEREAIIEAVWPEEEAIGVSDWAIDRLVARVRTKLKKQNNNFEIITVKTRGYKLTTSA